MKNKILLPIILIISLCVLIGCVLMFNDNENIAIDGGSEEKVEQPQDEIDTEKNEEEDEKEVVGKISDYFPINNNTLYVYESENGDEYNYTVFNLYSNENTVQRIITAQFSLVDVEEVLKYENGTLKYINGTQRGSLYENLIDGGSDKYDIIVLQEPLQVDTAWQMSSDSMSVITDTSAIIETEIGSFSCIEITTNYTDGTFEKTYYAKDIGLVKTINTTSNGLEVVHVLSDFVENTSYEKEFPAYYFDAEAEQLMYMPVGIEFASDMDIVKNIQNALTSETDEENLIYNVLNGATINFIEIYEDENYVHVDLDNYNLTNAGVSGEEAMINGLVYSLCQFTNKENLKLTVNGNYYESEHLGLLEGLIKYNFSN